MDDHAARTAVFKEEMDKLRQSGLLSDRVYNKVARAYNAYYRRPQSAAETPTPSPAQPKPVRQKKVPTSEELRERNITWILILGVIMVLLSGVILATSSWEALNAAAKTLLIGLTAVFFFGVSVIAEKWLKIDKTSYAFWILGSLFLPAAILSAGFFQLMGTWLSVTGEGRYLLGLIGAVVCLPVYILSSYKYHSRLFVWLSLVTLSTAACFLLASLRLPVDWFFFGIVIYNSLLIGGCVGLGGKDRLSLYTKELPLFIQMNLILSTLFMLGIFKDNSVYGLNIILTAVLYCFMVFYREKKEYSYVFGVLLVYGIYQVVEHTSMASMDLVLFALVGFIFLGFEYTLRKEERLKDIFRYMSGFVSFCAFIFISVKGIQLRMEHSSWMLLLSYLLIAANYTYLAYKTRMWIFSYLAPVFLFSAAYQFYRLLQSAYIHYSYSIHMFASALLVFTLLYYLNKWKFLQRIRRSSGIAALLVMLYAALYAVYKGEWMTSAVLFMIYGTVLWIIYERANHRAVKGICRWVMPAAWFLGLLLLFGKIEPYLNFQRSFYDFPLHFGLAAACIFLLHILWGKYQKGLEQPFFWAAQGFLLLAILSSQMNFEFIRYKFPVVYLMITGIYIYSMLRAHREWERKLFLYGAFTLLPLVLNALFKSMHVTGLWQDHLMLISSLCIGILWLVSGDEGKKRISYYLIPFSILGAAMTAEISGYDRVDFYFLVFYTAFILFINHRSKLQLLNIMPLGILFVNILSLDYRVFQGDKMPMLVTLLAAALILRTAGQMLHRGLYGFTGSQKALGFFDLDWYSIFSLLCMAMAFVFIPSDEGLGIRLLPHILFSAWFFSQIGRWGEGTWRRIGLTLAALSIFVPYYKLLGEIDIPKLFITELQVLPWLAMTIGLRRKVWKENELLMKRIELAVLLIISMVLFKDVIPADSLQEGLVMGALSMAAILIGMQVRMKYYFLVGTADLLLSVLLLTREFWQSVPWWGYLLGAGLLLIIVASITEMQKNRGGGKPLERSKEMIRRTFEGWK